MAATMDVQIITGPSPGTFSSIDGTNFRHNTADVLASDGSDNPMVIPDTGLTNYGFWKTLALVCLVTPTTLADDLRFYINSTDPGVGVSYIGALANVGDDAGYRQASGVTGESGDELTTTNHTGLAGTPDNALDWDSGSPLALSGSIASGDTGQWGDLVVLQAVVTDAVASGEGVQQECVFVWDET